MKFSKMPLHNKTSQEFIQNYFSPIIAVLCSPKVDSVMKKNNLSFTELLQPFTTMDWEGQFREPGGTVCIVKNWKLIIRDVTWKPLQPMEARRELNNAVLHNYNDKMFTLDIDGRKLDVPQSTPWFDTWRETYLEVQFPSDHEFTKHFLACIIVGTTFDDNIVDTFNGLNQQYAQLQNVLPPKLPKWFNSEVLKTYLLLHDVSSVPKEKADASFDQLKQTFGAANCFMLCINSKGPSDHNVPTDMWNQYVKRTFDNSTEMSSSMSSSTIELQQLQNISTNIYNTGADDENTLAQVSHPLTVESEVYDNANSLQASAFTGSIESVNTVGKPVENEVYCSALNASDVDAVKMFLQDYASKALLPYVEKQIAQLSEVVSNKKGVSRSLLSATKRWFGSGKPGNTTGNNSVIYSSDCQELQLRRLGDLWFMCGQWQRAFDTYHTAKREFYADSAWLCYAGALEMAAISAFMAGDANRKTYGYMEESIVTYLNTCRMVQYAVRATLLSVLCLSSTRQHGEAAKQLIRMTSENSDLRSAMLLEQAAMCFLAGPGSKAMCRKYAFHMVLAGHRFTKAGQKKHAYRCYQQAYQVYGSSGWRLATDHAAFALGRLGGALGNAAVARRWLCEPLAPLSPQPASQHHSFLKEYMLAHQQWMEHEEVNRSQLPTLPLPLLERATLAVLCVGPAPLSAPCRTPASSLTMQDAGTKSPNDLYWAKLEEMLVQVAQGSVPMIFRPTVDLYTDGTDSNPNVPQGEPVQIAVTLRNPLKISLLLQDIELLWQFVPREDEEAMVLNNESLVAAGKVQEGNVTVGQKLSAVMMEGECKKVVTFTLTPLKMGQLLLTGVAYKLINAVESGNENKNGLVISGKLELCSEGVTDKRLHIIVTPPAPCLQITFSETNPDVVSGEMRTLDVEFRNVGPVDMKNIYVAVSHPDCVSLVGEETGDFSTLYDEKYRESPAYSDERAGRVAAWRTAAARHVRRAAGALGSGACVRETLLLRPRAPPSAPLRLLAYYEPAHVPIGAKAYRLLRHVFAFNVTEAVEISVTPRRNLSTINTDVLENISLVVEAQNICNNKENDMAIDILEASLLSRQWKLTDIVRDTNKEHTLVSREKLHLILKSRRTESPPDGIVEWSSLKISQTHPESRDNINVAPYSYFVTDNKSAYFDSSDQFIQNDEGSKGGLIQSMFVVRWKVHNRKKGRTAVGQHCLWLDCFTKTQTNEEQSDQKSTSILLDELDVKIDAVPRSNKKDNVVLYKLEHTKHVKHDFNKKRLCLIPVTLRIVNCYELPVNVFIDMSRKQAGEAVSCSLGWTGALSIADVDVAEGRTAGVRVALQRLEARCVRVLAICARPGTYCVGARQAVVDVTGVGRGGNDVAQAQTLANNTSLLVVTQAAA